MFHNKLGFGRSPGQALDYPFGLSDVFTPFPPGASTSTPPTPTCSKPPRGGRQIAADIIKQRAGLMAWRATRTTRPSAAWPTIGRRDQPQLMAQISQLCDVRSRTFEVHITPKSALTSVNMSPFCCATRRTTSRWLVSIGPASPQMGVEFARQKLSSIPCDGSSWLCSARVRVAGWPGAGGRSGPSHRPGGESPAVAAQPPGQDSLSPSLFERNAYQFYLRQHTNEISAVRYDVCGGPPGGATTSPPAGVARHRPDGGPLLTNLETNAPAPGYFGRWTMLKLAGTTIKAGKWWLGGPPSGPATGCWRTKIISVVSRRSVKLQPGACVGFDIVISIRPPATGHGPFGPHLDRTL